MEFQRSSTFATSTRTPLFQTARTLRTLTPNLTGLTCVITALLTLFEVVSFCFGKTFGNRGHFVPRLLGGIFSRLGSCLCRNLGKARLLGSNPIRQFLTFGPNRPCHILPSLGLNPLGGERQTFHPRFVPCEARQSPWYERGPSARDARRSS